MDENAREYTAKDVADAAGISGRQLNDWDAKGVLPPNPREKDGWRKYTPREIFVLMVMAELRRAYNVPVQKLKYVRDFMLKPPANHFKASVELIDMLGVPVMLLTDFESTFMIDSVLEFVDLMEMGYFSGDESGSFVLLKINPIVNRLLGCLKEPIKLEEHGRGYEIMRQSKGLTLDDALTKEERRILEILRFDEFERVEIRKKEGKPIRVVGTERIAAPATASVENLVAKSAYQKVTASVQDGRIATITREVSFPLPGESNA